MSWPKLLVLIVGVSGFLYWSTRDAVNAKEIGQAAGEAVAESMKNQTDELIDQAINKTAEEMVDRSGEVADKVLNDTIEQAADKASDRLKDLSIENIFGVFEEIKDTGLRTSRDMAYELDPISLDDEWAYGADVGKALREQLAVANDQSMQSRIERLAEPIYKLLNRTIGKKYRITIIESEEVNAFALLGGQIFVATGLIDRMGTDEAIQSVLAHEIAHVELEHCVRGSWFGNQARGQIGSNVLSNILANSYTLIAERGFSEKQELESDAFAFRSQYRLGVSRQDRLRFISVLWELESERSSTDNGHDDENPVMAALSRHYRTHPPASERYEQLMNIEDDMNQP